MKRAPFASLLSPISDLNIKFPLSEHIAIARLSYHISLAYINDCQPTSS